MNKKILIVDDNYTNRFVIKNILSEYELDFAESAEEMRERLDESIPDLIVLDVMMPDENGFEAATKLKTSPKHSDIPIIFVTAKSETDDIREGFNIGGDDYITKPIDAELFKIRVNSVLKKNEEKKELRNDAFFDSLTQLYDRKYFMKRATEWMSYVKRGKSVSLAMFDIDHFKNINDSYGHQAGDYILKEFSKVIEANIREYDLLARYGGEEFIILFVDSEKEDIKKRVEKTRIEIEEKIFNYNSYDIKFTFSAGLSNTGDFEDGDEITLPKLIKIADDRLYMAKSSGRNKVVDNG